MYVVKCDYCSKIKTFAPALRNGWVRLAVDSRREYEVFDFCEKRGVKIVRDIKKYLKNKKMKK